MKMHELRKAGVLNYYKLAVWDDLRMCWRDGGTQFESYAAAVASAPCGIKHRVSCIPTNGDARIDYAPFVK